MHVGHVHYLILHRHITHTIHMFVALDFTQHLIEDSSKILIKLHCFHYITLDFRKIDKKKTLFLFVFCAIKIKEQFEFHHQFP